MMTKIGHNSFFQLLAAILLLSASAFAQAENLTPSDALNATERWASAVGQADISERNDLLHNNYLHIHATELEDGRIYTLKLGMSY